MHPDARLLLVARVLRNFAYGYLGVVVGLYLDLLGFSPAEIGLVLTASAAGSVALSIGWSLFADRVGRRQAACALAVLMVLGGIIFTVSANFPLLILAAFVGSLSATGTDAGVFLTMDQALLPQVASDRQRTWTFGLQNTLGTLAVAIGALGAGSVGVAMSVGLHAADAYRPLFVVFTLIGLGSLVLFSRLSSAIEVPVASAQVTHLGLGESRGTVATLVVISAFDSLGGGLVVQSIIAYWFYLTWHFDAAALAVLFFWSNVLAAVSMLSASWFARRIGLMNTMLLSQVPMNVLTLLLPFAPTAGLAAAVMLARSAVGQAFLPARLSYVMAIVQPHERSAAAGFTNVARGIASAITPAVSGVAFSMGWLGLPFIAAGLMRLAFNWLLFDRLGQTRPPEETE